MQPNNGTSRESPFSFVETALFLVNIVKIYGNKIDKETTDKHRFKSNFNNSANDDYKWVQLVN